MKTVTPREDSPVQTVTGQTVPLCLHTPVSFSAKVLFWDFSDVISSHQNVLLSMRTSCERSMGLNGFLSFTAQYRDSL